MRTNQSLLPVYAKHARCAPVGRRLLDARAHVAVGFFGLPYRNLLASLPFIERHCFDVLRNDDVTFDVFVHSMFVTNAHHSVSAKTVQLDPYSVVLLRPCVFEVEHQATVAASIHRRIKSLAQFPSNLWHGDLESVTNYLVALRSLRRLAVLIEERAVSTGRPYDAVVVMRADTLLTCDVDVLKKVQFFRRRPNAGAVCAPSFGSFGGVNDRFAVGTTREMTHVYMQREREAWQALGNGSHPTNSEKLLGRVLHRSGARRCATAVVVQRIRPSQDAGEYAATLPRMDTLDYLYDELAELISRRRRRSWWRTAGRRKHATAMDVCRLAVQASSQKRQPPFY